jgi:hypothetical protein
VLQDAADAGITVLVAAGDALATDGVADKGFHVDFPASSPWVIACGGTEWGTVKRGTPVPGAFEFVRDIQARETVWNEGTTGTGGGISAHFPVPEYQRQTFHSIYYPDDSRMHRGIPDVTGNASSRSPYKIVLGGKTRYMWGTSAVAPLWAGIVARANEAADEAGRSHVGCFLRDLYAGNQGEWRISATPGLRRITVGDNRHRDGGGGYRALPDWSPCAGWGAPNGLLTIQALAQHLPEKIQLSTVDWPGNSELSLHYQDAKGTIHELELADHNAVWTRADPVPSPANKADAPVPGRPFATVGWVKHTGPERRLYYQRADNVLMEHSFTNGKWGKPRELPNPDSAHTVTALAGTALAVVEIVPNQTAVFFQRGVKISNAGTKRFQTRTRLDQLLRKWHPHTTVTSDTRRGKIPSLPQ